MSYQYKNITTANTFVLTPRRNSTLAKVTINKADAHTITIYNGQDANGDVVATLKASAPEGTYHYEAECANGITVVTAASFAGDVTVSFV